MAFLGFVQKLVFGNIAKQSPDRHRKTTISLPVLCVRMLSIQNSMLHSARINHWSSVARRMLETSFVVVFVVTGPDRARASVRLCIIWWSPTAFWMRILKTCLVRLLATPWHQTEKNKKKYSNAKELLDTNAVTRKERNNKNKAADRKRKDRILPQQNHDIRKLEQLHRKHLNDARQNINYWNVIFESQKDSSFQVFNHEQLLVQRQIRINLKSSSDVLPEKRWNWSQATHSKSIWMLNVAVQRKNWNDAKANETSLKLYIRIFSIQP